jgi:hypothetical protein
MTPGSRTHAAGLTSATPRSPAPRSPAPQQAPALPDSPPPALLPPGREARGKDWQILLELATGIARRGGLRARLHGMEAAFLRRLTPRRLIALALRFGPYGARLHPFRKGLSLRELE